MGLTQGDRSAQGGGRLDGVLCSLPIGAETNNQCYFGWFLKYCSYSVIYPKVILELCRPLHSGLGFGWLGFRGLLGNGSTGWATELGFPYKAASIFPR